MRIKTILFDLDGTLLPMDQDKFISEYCKSLAMKMATYGYDPKNFINNLLKGTQTMLFNNGDKTNEKAFWEVFENVYGKKVYDDMDKFEKFYQNEFQDVKWVCGYNEESNKVIKLLKEQRYQLILATNPLFPAIATESRMKWAGLEKNDFEYVTTYENSSYSKPNIKYYEELINKLNLDTSKCLMVGNDVGDDMVAANLGMSVFLLTDYLINTKNEDISKYPNGNFNDLINYINKKNSEE